LNVVRVLLYLLLYLFLYCWTNSISLCSSSCDLILLYLFALTFTISFHYIYISLSLYFPNHLINLDNLNIFSTLNLLLICKFFIISLSLSLSLSLMNMNLLVRREESNLFIDSLVFIWCHFMFTHLHHFHPPYLTIFITIIFDFHKTLWIMNYIHVNRWLWLLYWTTKWTNHIIIKFLYILIYLWLIIDHTVMIVILVLLLLWPLIYYKSIYLCSLMIGNKRFLCQLNQLKKRHIY